MFLTKNYNYFPFAFQSSHLSPPPKRHYPCAHCIWFQFMSMKSNHWLFVDYEETISMYKRIEKWQAQLFHPLSINLMHTREKIFKVIKLLLVVLYLFYIFIVYSYSLVNISCLTISSSTLPYMLYSAQSYGYLFDACRWLDVTCAFSVQTNSLAVEWSLKYIRYYSY